MEEMLAARRRRSRRGSAPTRCPFRSCSTRSIWSTRSRAGDSRTDSPRLRRSRLGRGRGLDELRATVAALFSERFEAVRLLIPYEAGDKLCAELYELGASVDEHRPSGRRLRPGAAQHADLHGGSPRSSSWRRTRRRRAGKRDGAPNPAAARMRSSPGAGVRGHAGLDLAACDRSRSARVSGRSSAPAWPSPSPRAMPASSSRAPARRRARDHGPQHPRADRLRLPRRGAGHPAQRGRVAPFVVEPGMRIAQLVVVPVAEIEPVEVEELPASERGVRGFGSSRA